MRLRAHGRAEFCYRRRWPAVREEGGEALGRSVRGERDGRGGEVHGVDLLRQGSLQARHHGQPCSCLNARSPGWLYSSYEPRLLGISGFGSGSVCFPRMREETN